MKGCISLASKDINNELLHWLKLLLLIQNPQIHPIIRQLTSQRENCEMYFWMKNPQILPIERHETFIVS